MDRTSHHMKSRPRRSRRASVIILAVAVLAVLAISAASYVTITRLDRSSAAAYSRKTGFLQQRDAALGHIEALIAADFFSNKFVESTTPRRDANSNPIWPRKFEDGEHWDYPSAVIDPGNPRYSFDARETQNKIDNDNPADFNGGKSVLSKAVGNLMPAGAPEGLDDGAYYEFAFPDDAWLAFTEPADMNDVAGVEWDTWPQITNLRSEFRWDNEHEQWERNDGRYIDWANFFLSDVSDDQRRGDPGADLTILDQEADDALPSNTDEEFAGPRAMVDQPVYHLQSAHLEEARQESDYTSFNPDDFDPSDTPFENVDTRMWADTDGDGRPDARWQQLDSLSGSKGLVWGIAARVIDASSLVNVNVALGAGDPNKPETIAAGMTPADIDLRRLLETASRTTDLTAMHHPDIVNISSQDFNEHFNEHLLNGLSLGTLDFVNEQLKRTKVFSELGERLIAPVGGPAADSAFTLWLDDVRSRGQDSVPNNAQAFRLEPTSSTAHEPLTRLQREAHYRFVGADFTNSPLRFRRGYDWKDNETDLRAFLGFNLDNSLSPLEQRLDGPEDANSPRLPGAPPPYPEVDSLGPLRSKEDMARVRTFSDSVQNDKLPDPSFSGDFNQEEKVDRIIKDVRRLLTTYNGSGFIGPQAGWFGRAGEERLRLTLGTLPEPLSTTTLSVEEWEREMIPFAQDALGKFMWALAPFSTDRPPARAADGDPASTADLFEIDDSRAAYGGWQGGPAERFDTTPGSGDSGAIFALRTSAALTVNLIDAMDNEDDTPTPTVLRVHKTYDINQARRTGQTTLNNSLAPSAESNGVIEVGVDFQHGRLPIGATTVRGASAEDVLPDLTPSSGPKPFDDSTGFTVVGLDRQPFLREVHAFSVYAKSEITPPPGGTVDIDPSDPANHVGGILAVEIGNPWPDPIALEDYSVILTTNAPNITISLGAVADGNPIIQPGEVVVAYFPTAPGAGPFPNLWTQDVIDNWKDDIRPRTPNLLEIAVEGVLVNGTQVNTSTDPVFFDIFRSGGLVPTALLVRDMPASAGGGQVLLDRLSPAPGATAFPFASNAPQSIELASNPFFGYDPTSSSGQDILGVFVDAASLSRPTESPVQGFPAYVIEDPDQNTTDPIFDPSLSYASVLVGSEQPLIDQLIPFNDDTFNRLGKAKDPFGPSIQSFQLFVPDGPLLSPTELLQLSVYAHVFQPGAAAPILPEVRIALEASGGLNQWTTVSEQLGEDIAIFYDGAGGVTNPFFGTLDFSRGIPGEDILTTAIPVDKEIIPNELRVPLAVRVMDAFETLGSLGSVAQGRINLNTAPDRVLSLLPLMDPRDPTINYTSATIGTWTPASSRNRHLFLMDWREPLRPTPIGSPSELRLQLAMSPGQPELMLDEKPEKLSQLTGLREDGDPSVGEPAGLVSLGELALMYEWDASMGLPSGSREAFDELGVDGGGQSVDVIPANGAIDIRESFPDFDGVDDIEERLAIARAVSAVSSNRSDVFIAWFIIRAYSPAAIEAIPVDPQNMNEDERAELLNDLDPEHESRWLAVLDRSKVRRPTDRPEVVLLVELPSTSP